MARKTALIVDDNRALAEDLAEILESEGYQSRVIFDPRSLLGEDACFDFDVALLDVRMPALDGVSLQRILMRRRPHARFVLMTAYEDDRHIVQGLPSGVSAVLTKPVLVEQLLLVLAEPGAARRPQP
jgi:DNA-binding response OmpR family regulator